MRTRTSICLAGLIVTLACAALAGVAVQAAGASTLAVETFQATFPGPPGHQLNVTCNPTAGTLTYHVEGTASGPHPGTFVEDGTAAFDPQTGTLLAFDAVFSITSVGGDVSGEKHFVPTVPIPGDPNVPGTVVCGPDSDTLTSTSICYRASFAGGGTEVGFSLVNLDFVEPSQGQVGGTFFEDFIPDPTASCGVCPADDEDDDGLTDDRESLFFTLLGNSDSDLDGVQDGNDDANSDGVDDEDEDDDEDECANDDDEDGVEDEDEDD